MCVGFGVRLMWVSRCEGGCFWGNRTEGPSTITFKSMSEKGGAINYDWLISNIFICSSQSVTSLWRVNSIHSAQSAVFYSLRHVDRNHTDTAAFQFNTQVHKEKNADDDNHCPKGVYNYLLINVHKKEFSFSASCPAVILLPFSLGSQKTIIFRLLPLG